MESIKGVQYDSSGSCASESRRNFFADRPGFSDAKNHDFVSSLKGDTDQIDRDDELGIQTRGRGRGFRQLNLKNPSRTFKVIHATDHASIANPDASSGTKVTKT
jgi:hypothetical protein